MIIADDADASIRSRGITASFRKIAPKKCPAEMTEKYPETRHKKAPQKRRFTASPNWACGIFIT